MDANSTELNDARAKALRVIAKMHEDPEFSQRLRSATADILAEEGLSSDQVASLRKNASPHNEAMPNIWCADTTCWTSECGPTCYVTFFW